MTTEARHRARRRIVVATNTPVNDLVVDAHQAGAVHDLRDRRAVPRNAVTTALYWDTGDPYHYVRLCTAIDADHDLLIVGGEDHKTGQADDIDQRHPRLEAWARERFPRWARSRTGGAGR